MDKVSQKVALEIALIRLKAAADFLGIIFPDGVELNKLSTLAAQRPYVGRMGTIVFSPGNDAEGSYTMVSVHILEDATPLTIVRFYTHHAYVEVVDRRADTAAVDVSYTVVPSRRDDDDTPSYN